MVTNRKTLEKIREIIEKHYTQLTMSILGKDVFTENELKKMKQLGFDTSTSKSLLELLYNHSFINNPIDVNSPTSVSDMKNQQSVKGLVPQGEAHQSIVEHLNDKTKQLIDKLKIDALTRIEGIIRENNSEYRSNALQNIDRPDELDELVKESTIGKLKQKLRDTAKAATGDWNKVAITEMSNAIGIGSVDRIVSDNSKKELDAVFVYRISRKDAKLCKWCNRFYVDSDGSPKVYKLSTLLDNGSNYGKKRDEWIPVTGATHPNERCSGILELRPGFKVNTDGSVTYIGLDKWQSYIFNKVQN